ncbi:hypothetical protein Tco_1138941, partial [Tanacetum coccineum]
SVQEGPGVRFLRKGAECFCLGYRLQRQGIYVVHVLEQQGAAGFDRKGFLGLRLSGVETSKSKKAKRNGEDGEGLYVREELIVKRISPSVKVKVSRSKILEVEGLKFILPIAEDHLKETVRRIIARVNNTQAQALLYMIMDSEVQKPHDNPFSDIPEFEKKLDIRRELLEKEGFNVKMQSAATVKVIKCSNGPSCNRIGIKVLVHISEAGQQVLEKQGLLWRRKSSRLRVPSQVNHWEERRYFLSIIDDYSRGFEQHALYEGTARYKLEQLPDAATEWGSRTSKWQACGVMGWCYERRDGFAEEEQDQGVSRSLQRGKKLSLLKKEFDIKELGEANKILGMEIVRDQSRKILRVSQSWDCDVERMSKVPYANAVGSLMYLMVCTMPDIAYADSLQPCRRNYSFVESDYAKDPDKGKRRSIRPLRRQERKLFLRTKHINVRHHFIREVLEAKTVEVLKVGTEHNAVDALTKVVRGHKLQHCLELLSVGIG